MNYRDLAATIIENIGGKENVNQVVHCATRLRFRLKDEAKAKTDVLKKTSGVLSVINAGGQYQVVIGPDVAQVYQEVVDLGGFEAMAQVPDDEPKKEQNKLSALLEFIASIFQPIIPPITAGGLIKAVMALLVTLNLLDKTTQTYSLLSAFADAPFYFLPVLLASSAAKRFKCNQFIAMALGGILIYPSFITMVTEAKAAGTGIAMFGIPITLASYSSSVIPIILGVWFMSYVEKYMNKVSPKAIKFFSVPMVSLVVSGIVTLAVLGPIGTWVGNILAAFFKWLDSTASWAVPTLVGTLSPLLVMTGTHYGLIPIGVNNLATAGFDTVVGPGMLASNVAQGAAGFAVAVRSKNKQTKELAASAGLTGVLGITEPVLYGINLKFVYPLIGAMIGGFTGGLYMGIMKTGRYAAGSPGLLVLPGYIGGEGMTNFVNACIGTGVAIVVSFIATFVLFGIYAKQGKLDAEETGAGVTTETNTEVITAKCGDKDIVSVADGKILSKDEILDDMFKEETMGKTIGVDPVNGIIVSPANGTLEMVYETGHAFAVRTNNGRGILVHIGINTVELKGQGFKTLKKQGETVKAGEPIVEVDDEAVKKAGYSMQTFTVITETEDGDEITFEASGDVTKGQKIGA
ncbi:beta-glucoside-specific PTS transporter subunit IIABC [Oribacterium sp. WCC10]|uniref:beta-glucoside-specific PTS transporter subunit IIABC n=1 Tax=Oribacterium sp. WCC10 TaxID=1855343 RepID=UPI0008DFB656|nr:beta-glucoside-specific PTS transporter subunit IIABC [Oribacterium sp. WCC10]SFG36258.1 PTS system beta-glucoside-specific IIA component, Glc family /PTS system beta-glucoside-specific IIB component, Glc family /PTS system beta-glucoside-specific IIC component, Glc family [Oribacterium sp. WCC10]